MAAYGDVWRAMPDHDENYFYAVALI